jgi:hypothetical protein
MKDGGRFRVGKLVAIVGRRQGVVCGRGGVRESAALLVRVWGRILMGQDSRRGTSAYPELSRVEGAAL